MHWLHLLGLCLAALALAGSVYALISAGAVVRLLRRPPLHAPSLPPVTLLKPLHGAEPLLTQNLESFLAQDYPAPVQVIFGVQNAADPAIATVRALQAKYPERDLDLVIDAHLSGTNRKISNLVNMFPRARHDALVLSDSDISVPPHWLRTVIATLAQPGVGAVTCLYSGKSAGGLWARMAAMGISYQFLPNVAVGKEGGSATPVLAPPSPSPAQPSQKSAVSRPFPAFWPMITKSDAPSATGAIACRSPRLWSNIPVPN